MTGQKLTIKKWFDPHEGQGWIIAVALLFVVLACNPHVDRQRWAEMTHEDKTIYVSSLAGAQAAAHAKGGLPHVPHGTPEEIVAAIDAAYKNGDERTPDEIFATLPALPEHPSK